jgi:hypothetical protein
MTPLCLRFCRELNAGSFEKKLQPETMKTERDIDKILNPSLFLGHPLQRFAWKQA